MQQADDAINAAAIRLENPRRTGLGLTISYATLTAVVHQGISLPQEALWISC